MKSIDIGQPSRSAEASQQEQQMRAMILERCAARRGSAAPTLPTVVTVTAPLTVDWPLSAGDAAARLIAAGELQDKITAADLGGAKDKQSLSAEQQEVSDELAQMATQYREQQGPWRATVHVCCRFSDQQMDRAIAEAFAKAKREAALVAKAAGAGLGSIRSVTKSSGSLPGSEEAYAANPYLARSYMVQMAMQMQMDPSGGNAKDNEVYGSTQPRDVPGRRAMQL